MISVHLHGIGEHLAFVATALIWLSAPVVTYFWGRSDGRDATDDDQRDGGAS
jgi:hypothetical protein